MAKPKLKATKSKNKETKDNMILFTLPFVLCFLSILFFTTVALIFDINKSINFPVMLVLICICLFVSAYLSSMKKRQNGLVTGIIYNTPTIILILFLSAISNSFKIDFNVLITLIASIIVSALGGIMGVNSKLRPKRGIR